MTKLLTEGEIERIWQKARPIPGYDPRLYRIAPDVIQTLIRRDRYNMQGEHGWRIEHGHPVSFAEHSILTALSQVQGELLARQARQARRSRNR